MSYYKRCKTGHVPGDLSKRVKIRMLEKKVPIKVFDWQIINERCAKTFRKDHHRKANRRFRHNSRKEINNVLTDL